MADTQIPHPIPYQGSKRQLASAIAHYVGKDVKTLYEPFAGSAAFSLYAARHQLAERFVIGDVLEPLVELWRLIVSAPHTTADRYETIWKGQLKDDPTYYYRVREQYNQNRDPVMLLYLIARCVKNAVRFGKDGRFTQSADKRRIGMHPKKMREAIQASSWLLNGRVTFFAGDFAQCVEDASQDDLIYMDPPYQGTTYGRDKRYYQQLSVERLYEILHQLNRWQVPFILSYDGRHGDKEYGQVLPEALKTHRVLINAGRSSQATLNGKNTITVEALYLSQGLAETMTSWKPVGEEQMPLGI
jgi:DNA adenine methylase